MGYLMLKVDIVVKNLIIPFCILAVYPHESDSTLSKVSYDPQEELTTITGKLTVGTLNGNKIGASAEGFGYTTDAPFIPVCKANGIMEVGNRLDFHHIPSQYLFSRVLL